MRFLLHSLPLSLSLSLFYREESNEQLGSEVVWRFQMMELLNTFFEISMRRKMRVHLRLILCNSKI